MENYHKVLINMSEWIDIIDSNGTFTPTNIFEIGSLHGNDPQELESKYKTNNVFIFEAHPVFAEKIKNKYNNFNVNNIAITNYDGRIEFNGVDIDKKMNQGISSIHDRNGVDYKKYNIECKKMSTFIQENLITNIDLLKIDVEGHSYEVLEGFEDYLKIVKSIHIENEHIHVWVNQKLYKDVEELLIRNGFILTSIKSAWPQSDSIWIRRDLYNTKWWKD